MCKPLHRAVICLGVCVCFKCESDADIIMGQQQGLILVLFTWQKIEQLKKKKQHKQTTTPTKHPRPIACRKLETLGSAQVVPRCGVIVRHRSPSRTEPPGWSVGHGALLAHYTGCVAALTSSTCGQEGLPVSGQGPSGSSNWLVRSYPADVCRLERASLSSPTFFGWMSTW